MSPTVLSAALMAFQKIATGFLQDPALAEIFGGGGEGGGLKLTSLFWGLEVEVFASAKGVLP